MASSPDSPGTLPIPLCSVPSLHATLFSFTFQVLGSDLPVKTEVNPDAGQSGAGGDLGGGLHLGAGAALRVARASRGHVRGRADPQVDL